MHPAFASQLLLLYVLESRVYNPDNGIYTNRLFCWDRYFSSKDNKKEAIMADLKFSGQLRVAFYI